MMSIGTIISTLDVINNPGWFGDLHRGIWTGIINMIYSLVSFLCQGFTLMYQTTIFGDSVINQFSKRIYVVLGVYMLFKLVFSLLTAIVNPDKLFDKEAGMQKIISRTIIALILFIATPKIFELAISEQANIAKTVPKVILGKTGNDNGNDGEVLAATALTAFITPSSHCSEATELQSNLAISEILFHVTDTCPTNKSFYTYDFNWFIGIVGGIVMLVFIASYTVDMAVRAIKIGILRVIAPIPIISYIDPKSAKDGAFNNWLKESVSTYLQLFIKLAVLYLILYLLSGLSDSSLDLIVFPEGINVLWVGYLKFFLIVGAFMFMGKASTFICNLIGIKPDESGLLGGLAGLGAAAGIGLSAISSTVAGARSSALSSDARGLSNRRKTFNAIAGATWSGITGTVASTRSAASAKNGKFGAAMSTASKRNSARMANGAAGASFFGSIGAGLSETFLGETAYDREERSIKEAEAYGTALDNVASRMSSEMVKSGATRGLLENGNYANYKQFKAVMDAAASAGLTSFEYEAYDENGASLGKKTITMERANSLVNLLAKNNEDDYIRRVNAYNDSYEGVYQRVQENHPEYSEAQCVDLTEKYLARQGYIKDNTLTDYMNTAQEAGKNIVYTDVDGAEIHGNARITSRKQVKGDRESLTIEIGHRKTANETNKANKMASNNKPPQQ